MARLVISASARRDIGNVLHHSGRHWGVAQRRRYRFLIEQALNDLLESPEHPRSRARNEIRSGIRTFHIARRGQAGRHLIVYRIAPTGDLHILRLLHDAMEVFGALSRIP